jgi:hypothetical protein
MISIDGKIWNRRQVIRRTSDLLAGSSLPRGGWLSGHRLGNSRGDAFRYLVCCASRNDKFQITVGTDYEEWSGRAFPPSFLQGNLGLAIPARCRHNLITCERKPFCSFCLCLDCLRNAVARFADHENHQELIFDAAPATIAAIISDESARLPMRLEANLRALRNQLTFMFTFCHISSRNLPLLAQRPDESFDFSNTTKRHSRHFMGPQGD